MNLFQQALGGAGESLQSMATTWNREESAINIDKVRAELDQAKARLVADLQRQSDTHRVDEEVRGKKSLLDYAQSPEVVSREAARAAAIKGAETANTGYTLNPGDQRFTGDKPGPSNARPTSQEVQERLYRDSLKGGSKPKPFDGAALDRLLKDDYFKDEAGAIDHEARGLARSIVGSAAGSGVDPYQARDTVLQAIAVAKRTAGGDKAALAEEYRKLRVASGLEKAAAANTEGPTRIGTDESRAAERAARGRTATELERQARLSPDEFRAEREQQQQRVAQTESEPQLSRRRAPNRETVDALTPEAIGRMSRDEAEDVKRRLWNQLSGDQKRAVNRRISFG